MAHEPYRTAARPIEARENDLRCVRCSTRTERFSMFATREGDICELCFRSWRAAESLRASDLRSMSSYTWQLVCAAVSGIWLFLMIATPAGQDDGKEHVGSNLFFIAGSAALAWKLWSLQRKKR